MDERKWWKECVVYQIYPQSFCDSNGDGIGDLQGIIGKLDYIAGLGVDVIWLSPVYPSPGYDNGYDISDYEGIDPKYGTMDDFLRLLNEAHRRGLKVIIDLVVNHTSDLHPWFQESSASPDSAKRDYYIWRDGIDGGGPPNNWGALFGGGAWTQTEPGGQYYLHLFSPHQPDLNWENKSLREDIYAMIRRWLDRGVDGFRMDVISLIAKPGDFSGGPAGPSGYFDPRGRIAANPKLHEYIREMRGQALSNNDIMTVAEAAALSIEEACLLTDPKGSELDMLFQFEHMDLDGGETFKWTDRTIPLAELKRVMGKWQRGLEKKGWNALFWNNHDQPRMLSRMGCEGALRETSAKMLATCLHMMKGTPFIYQGEELGMTNMSFSSPYQLRDSESLNAYRRYTESGDISEAEMLRYISLKSRDNARTPMQWSAEPGAGFTTAAPWMEINPNHSYINAQDQLGRDNSVFAHYRELIRLRRHYEIIVYGKYVPFDEENQEVFAFIRQLGGQKLFVCCNFTNRNLEFSPPEDFAENAELLLSNIECSTYMTENRLAPFEAVVLISGAGIGPALKKEV